MTHQEGLVESQVQTTGVTDGAPAAGPPEAKRHLLRHAGCMQRREPAQNMRQEAAT